MQTLLLNSTYEPLKVISWQRAVCLWFSGKVEIIEEYDDFDLKSVSVTIKCPAVVRLLKYIKGNKHRIKFSRINVFGRDKFTCQYCIHPDHKVLTADLQWIPAGELSIGQQLVGFDEHAVAGHRKFCTSEIQSYIIEDQELYKVTLSNGKEFRVTKDHKWLCRPFWGKYVWRTTDKLLGCSLQKHFTVWDEDCSKEAGWLAGMFDGEGWLRDRDGVQCAIAQRPGLVLDKLKNELTLRNFEFSEQVVKQTQDCVRLYIKGGGCEAVRLLGTLRSIRLLDKFRPEALGGLRAKESYEVVAVEPVGVGPVVKMRTSTSTFVADGYLHHNCGGQPGTHDLTYDHVLPRSRGGSTGWDNIVTCCLPCNAKKGDRTPSEAKLRLKRVPVKPDHRPFFRFRVNLPKTPEAWRSYLYWNQELENDGE